MEADSSSAHAVWRQAPLLLDSQKWLNRGLAELAREYEFRRNVHFSQHYTRLEAMKNAGLHESATFRWRLNMHERYRDAPDPELFF